MLHNFLRKPSRTSSALFFVREPFPHPSRLVIIINYPVSHTTLVALDCSYNLCVPPTSIIFIMMSFLMYSNFGFPQFLLQKSITFLVQLPRFRPICADSFYYYFIYIIYILNPPRKPRLVILDGLNPG